MMHSALSHTVQHARGSYAAPVRQTARFGARQAPALAGTGGSLAFCRRHAPSVASRAQSQKGASCSMGAPAEAMIPPSRCLRLTKAMIHDVCQQVEAECGEEREAEDFSDPLYAALEARKNALKAEKGESRFVQMAKRSVELASTMALGAPLVSELAVDSIVQLVASDEETVDTLLTLHGEEAQPLIAEHMAKVAYETDPIEVGNFQMRMPPMIGHGDIAIPHVFLSQVYNKSVAFGYALASAQERRELEGTLMGAFNVGAATTESGDASEAPALPTLAAYVYGCSTRSAVLQLADGSVARQVADSQTHRLFGHPVKLVHDVDRAMRFSRSPEEAQESLDIAMCDGGIPWLRVPASGLHRLMAEGLAYGHILCAVEHALPAEC